MNYGLGLVFVPCNRSSAGGRRTPGGSPRLRLGVLEL